MAIAAEIRSDASTLKPDVLRQDVVSISASIATTAKLVANKAAVEAKADYYSIDRFFVSVAQMLEADTNTILARP